MRFYCLASGEHGGQTLKQQGRFDSLNHNIYIVADPISVDVDHAAHVHACGPSLFTRNHDYPLVVTIVVCQGFFIVHSNIDSTAHRRALNSLEHYMHNTDDKHSTRPGFETSTYEFRATTGSSEPSGPAN